MAKSNVTIRMRGKLNSVLSNSGGVFHVPYQDKKDGDAQGFGMFQ